jgi:hypothetical protein
MFAGGSPAKQAVNKKALRKERLLVEPEHDRF